jgi:hypothetical protein
MVSTSYWKRYFFVFFPKSPLIGQFKLNMKELKQIKTLQSKRGVGALIKLELWSLVWAW